MCSHPDHEVVTLPDGQVDETHVFTDEDWQHVRMLRAVDRTIWAMTVARHAHSFPLTLDVT
ncbi:hypothetical protein [Streptomyces sp. NPDC005302]|uniref:hypothetical protein n=1 Tax=Streptomyces sp. NPDC005302 TaxID=3154675 RepID=UPI0033AF4BDB